jgi:acetylornithine deacetylase/succinyl-diaminopimelate desuccinylase-like protein
MHVVNPTMIESGFKANVVPTEARAVIDARLTHAGHELVLGAIRELAGFRVAVEVLHEDPPVQAKFATPLVNSMASALMAVDPTAVIAPYVVAGSTDAKAFAPLGIECYGFTPVLLPSGTPYWSLFHSADERVPIVGLEFGCEVLSHFMQNA